MSTPPPSRTPSESQILREIRLAVGQLPDVRIWRNSVGRARYPKGKPVAYGLCPGASDIIGIIGNQGRFLALEVKSAQGTVEIAQQNFIDLVRGLGGFAAVVRSVPEALAAIARARAGLRE